MSSVHFPIPRCSNPSFFVTHRVRAFLRGHVRTAADATAESLSWPPRSPDLTPCDFYPWGYVKDSFFYLHYRKICQSYVPVSSTPSLHSMWIHFTVCGTNWTTGLMSAGSHRELLSSFY